MKTSTESVLQLVFDVLRKGRAKGFIAAYQLVARENPDLVAASEKEQESAAAEGMWGTSKVVGKDGFSLAAETIAARDQISFSEAASQLAAQRPDLYEAYRRNFS